MLACTAASVALLAKPAVITCTHSKVTDHNCLSTRETDDSNVQIEMESSSSTGNSQLAAREIRCQQQTEL